MTYVLFKGLQGSRMYGLHKPTSDYDYRRIVLPERPDELLWHDWKNHATDPHTSGEDVQTYTLLSFLKGLCKPSPNMIEMLFTPEDCIFTLSTLWTRIVRNRELFLTKKVIRKAFKGACYGYRERYKKKGDIKDLRHYYRLLVQTAGFAHAHRLSYPFHVNHPMKDDEYLLENADYYLSYDLDERFMFWEDYSDLPEDVDLERIKEFYTRQVMWWYGLEYVNDVRA